MTHNNEQMSSEFVIPPQDQAFYTKFGTILKTVREKNNITIQQIADLLNIDEKMVRAYEDATMAIPVTHFFEIARFMNWPQEFDYISA